MVVISGDKKVKKFKFSLINKNSKRITNNHGYGIYFIDDIKRARSYGNIINKVTIDGGADILDGKITPEQLLKIYNQLVKDGVKLRDNEEDWYKNPTYGEYSILNDVEEFYFEFGRGHRDILQTVKDRTEFLLRAGIDGMKVENEIGDKMMVVFNED